MGTLQSRESPTPSPFLRPRNHPTAPTRTSATGAAQSYPISACIVDQYYFCLVFLGWTQNSHPCHSMRISVQKAAANSPSDTIRKTRQPAFFYFVATVNQTR